MPFSKHPYLVNKLGQVLSTMTFCHRHVDNFLHWSKQKCLTIDFWIVTARVKQRKSQNCPVFHELEAKYFFFFIHHVKMIYHSSSVNVPVVIYRDSLGTYVSLDTFQSLSTEVVSFVETRI